MQPGFDQFGPVGYGESGVAQAVAVASFGVDVQFGADFGLLEG